MTEITKIFEPHVTVQLIHGLHTPAMLAKNSRDEVQTADTLAGEHDFASAKREAVEWARRLGIPYVAPRSVT